MSKLVRILSIDGGGMRGVIPGQVLVALEKKFQQKTGDQDVRLADFFDLVAGTSTGGILACLYLFPEGDTSRPRYSAQEAVDVYLHKGGKIFSASLFHRLRSTMGLSDEKYGSAGLEAVLEECFEDVMLSQLLKPCLISSYDIRRRRAFFLTQHDARKHAARNFLVRDAARATSAAPSYFECSKIRSETGISYPLIDGGVFANNPSLCAYAEARNHFAVKASEMAILSLGTGTAAQPYYYEHAKNWGALGWIKPLINIMMTGVSETVDYQCRTAFDAVGHPNQYLRVDARLDAMPPGVTGELDDASEKNLQGLREIGGELAEKRDRHLDEFVDLLIANR